MSDVFLIVSAIVISFIILATAFVFLVKFQHPDDKFQAWFPRLIIIASLYLIMAVPMIIPFDVANSSSSSLNVDILWTVAFIAVIVFSFAIVPFSFFYYESLMDSEDTDEGEQKCCQRQFWTAFWYTFVFMLIIAVLSIILYATPANRAYIPTHFIAQHASNLVTTCTGTPGSSTFQEFNNGDVYTCTGNGCSQLGNTMEWELSLTYVVYLFALLSFIGWFFMFIFAGVGLIALPMELINAYRSRPNPITRSTFEKQSKEIADRAGALIDECLELRDGDKGALSVQSKSISNRVKKRFGRSVLQMQNQYWDLRHDWEVLKISHNFSNSNPLWYILQLVLGIIAMILSVVWILHIILYMLPSKPIDPFLNTFFTALSNIAGGKFPLFGIIAYTIFVFYLLWCILCGNYKFGLRLLIFKVYPLEVGNTYVSAFLANIWVLLQTMFPMVQFLTSAFPVYARETSINALFGTQARYLNGFKVFWEHNIFVIMLLAMAVLTLPVMICCGGNRKKKLQKEIEMKTTNMRRTKY